MDENEFTKIELWIKRIQDFHESGGNGRLDSSGLIPRSLLRNEGRN